MVDITILQLTKLWLEKRKYSDSERDLEAKLENEVLIFEFHPFR